MIVLSSKILCMEMLKLAKNSPTNKYKTVHVLGGWLPWMTEK